MSAISGWSGESDGRGTCWSIAPVRAAVVNGRGDRATPGYGSLGGEDGLDEPRLDDAVEIDELLEGDALRGGRDRDDRSAARVDEINGRAEGEGDRTVELGELENFSLLGVDRDDDHLLRPGQARRRLTTRARSRSGTLRGRRWRRKEGPEDLHAGEEERDARAVEAGHDSDRLGRLVEGHDRELVTGQADDHVDVVAGLDERSHAGDP